MGIGTIHLVEESSLVRCFQCQETLIINNNCGKRHKSKDAPGGPVLSCVLLSEGHKCSNYAMVFILCNSCQYFSTTLYTECTRASSELKL